MRFITFSRKMGSNGTEVARRVAEKMGYKFFDTEAIERAAKEMGVLESVKEADEKAPSLFQRLFSQKPAIALDHLNSVVYELAERGDAVFLGRGSHILLKSFQCALHVRVTASLETRIHNLEARGFPRDAAVRAIERSDQERGAFIRYAFRVDWESPEIYDLVLNMDKLSIDLAVNNVINLARSEEIKACSVDSLKSLEMMSLASRAEAALTEAGMNYSPSISVSAMVLEPGNVRLVGFVSDAAARTRAEKIVSAIKGVVSVENQIQLVPADRHA
jgi:cytidylate kinase